MRKCATEADLSQSTLPLSCCSQEVAGRSPFQAFQVLSPVRWGWLETALCVLLWEGAGDVSGSRKHWQS